LEIIAGETVMPRGIMSKVDIFAKVIKMKHELGEGKYDHQDYEWRDGYDHALNQVLDIISEYSQ
jgi:hypothetical protein